MIPHVFSVLMGHFEYKLIVIWLFYISRELPCLGALSFGEDVGDNSSVMRFASTYVRMLIKQCVHIIFMSCVKTTFTDTKKRGIVLLPIPRTEALALPI